MKSLCTIINIQLSSFQGDGGAIGLTEDESALRRWMVAGPEVSRLASNYESKCGKKDENRKHHEETKSCQKVIFLRRVAKLYAVIEEMGSPFEEYLSDLLILHFKDIADPGKAEMVQLA